MYECDMSSEALTGFCDSLVFLHKSTLTENLVRVSLSEERGKNERVRGQLIKTTNFLDPKRITLKTKRSAL